MIGKTDFGSGWQELGLFGLVIYEFEFPGIICSNPDECIAQIYGGYGRYFGELSENDKILLRSYRDSDIHHIPIQDYLMNFGEESPSQDNITGFNYEPGEYAGDACLYFMKEPLIIIKSSFCCFEPFPHLNTKGQNIFPEI